MSSKCRRFEVLLPLRYHDGRAVPPEWFAEAVLEIVEQYGAASYETQKSGPRRCANRGSLYPETPCEREPCSEWTVGLPSAAPRPAAAPGPRNREPALCPVPRLSRRRRSAGRETPRSPGRRSRPETKRGHAPAQRRSTGRRRSRFDSRWRPRRSVVPGTRRSRRRSCPGAEKAERGAPPSLIPRRQAHHAMRPPSRQAQMPHVS